jgi:glyoxylase-like metal-dependent hydrolase (beta-lactamase superfamily II)
VKALGFVRAAHADDHAVWLLAGERVLHAADLIDPDQVPFLGYAGAESFVYHEANLRQAHGLDWLFVNGGHGNVGGKEDIAFDLAYTRDLRQAVEQAAQSLSRSAFVDPTRGHDHAAYTQAWRQAVVSRATDELRARYGRYYGYGASTPVNAEQILRSLRTYR